jgi:hypothetical protein
MCSERRAALQAALTAADLECEPSTSVDHEASRTAGCPQFLIADSALLATTQGTKQNMSL